jgi:hypothetical protein
VAIHYAEGKYVCEILKQGIGETKTGKPQFVLNFKVLGTPDPADPEHYIVVNPQYTRTYYRVITDKTIDFLKEDLQALGFNKGSFKFLDPSTPDFQDFTGAVVDMYCKHGENQDKQPKEDWGLARAAREFQVKPLEAKKMRDLDNLFGKHLKDLKAPAKPAAPAATDSGSVVAGDDDTPF